MIHQNPIRAVVAFVAMACLCDVSKSRGASWPEVRGFEATFTISDPSKAVLTLIIKTTSGEPAYLFVCRTGSDDSVPEVNYSGTLDCRLMEASGGEREENLLLESHAANLAAWYSRGRMFDYELYGDCAAYPEYGRVRHFRLRGMRLTMQFTDVVFNAEGPSRSPSVAAYKLTLTVEADANATRDIAESSGYLDPNVDRPGEPRSCSKVKRGSEWGDD